MPDEEVGQGTEAVTSEAPTDFREFAKWRATGELPVKEETPAAPAEEPAARTEPDSETDDHQETGDKEDDDAPDETPANKGKGGSRQRRIDKLTRENEELRRQVAQQAPPPQDKPPEPEKPADNSKPKLEDFQTLEAYQEALTDWKLDERERNREQAEAKAAAEDQVRKEQDAWSKQQAAARKAHKDYDDVMDGVMIPAGPGVMAARQALLEESNGAEILYHLATHPKELERIAALSPASAAVAIGKLSVALTPPAAPENGKPRITGAPKPPPPSGRSGKPVSDDPNDPDVQKDFPRWARAREAQIRGR